MRKPDLIFCDHYFPAKNAGGPPLVVQTLSHRLCEFAKPSIITSIFELGDKTVLPNILPNTWVSRPEANVFYWDGKLSMDQVAYSSIAAEEWNSVILNGLFSKKFTIPLLINRRIKRWETSTFLLPHGETSPWALKQKVWKKRPFILLGRLTNLFEKLMWIGLSDLEVEWTKDLGFCCKKVSVVPSQRSASELLIGATSELRAKSIEASSDHNDKLRLIFLGRIQSMKNLDFFLEVLKNIKKPLVLEIYGPTEKSDLPYLNKCQRLAENSQHEIAFHGHLPSDQAPQVLSSHDFLVLPSLSENLSLVCLEALAVGLPLVISEGVPWQVVENKCGLKLPVSHHLKWEIAIENLQKLSPKDLQLMKTNAKSYFQKIQLESTDSNALSKAFSTAQ